MKIKIDLFKKKPYILNKLLYLKNILFEDNPLKRTRLIPLAIHLLLKFMLSIHIRLYQYEIGESY